ncbi:hypothetical protein [Novosphingobium sp. FKTRR1]|uniref:hypothetical protein n=1 Tax=Novosphingobium sp. FKTRR1 TaxID=2879118 RepID=UPI001CF097C2|nr:hypothetical protein [Novosphingobium sp. FKTRR1]
MASDSSDHHFELAVQIAVEGLKNLFILNGGAATALIALTSQGGGGDKYALAVVLFGIGALCSVCAFASGYFSQLSYANHMKSGASAAWQSHGFFQKLTMGLVVLSLVTSGIGMSMALISSVGRWGHQALACTKSQPSTLRKKPGAPAI